VPVLVLWVNEFCRKFELMALHAAREHVRALERPAKEDLPPCTQVAGVLAKLQQFNVVCREQARGTASAQARAMADCVPAIVTGHLGLIWVPCALARSPLVDEYAKYCGMPARASAQYIKALNKEAKTLRQVPCSTTHVRRRRQAQ
jgi:hypothetical protein